MDEESNADQPVPRSDIDLSALPTPVDCRTFGVGCWEFGLHLPVPCRFVPAEYAELLESRLERIPTVNNVRVRVEGHPHSYDVAEDDPTDSESGKAHFPDCGIIELEFDLYIPFRVQDELLKDIGSECTATEHFHITSRYTYYSPVIFVESLDATEPANPSTAVVVVREYLRREIADSADDIVFDFLGPSPFHADFFLAALPVERTNVDLCSFALKRLQPRGYAELTFFYRAAEFPDPREALEALFDELEDELGLFYRIHRINRGNYDHWSEIEELLQAVTVEEESASWWDRIRGARSRGRKVARLHRLLTNFEASQILERHSIEHSYRLVYERDTEAFLGNFIDSALKNRPVFPVQQV